MELVTKKKLMLVAGRGHTELSQEIAEHLQRPARRRSMLSTFANGEIYCRYGENIRGADVFVLQSHCEPINDRIMEQLIMIDAAKRASAKRITAVCPFYGYARQDRKAEGREPITARLVADMLTVGRRRPRRHRRPAHRPDPGLLRLPGRPPHRRARCSPSTSPRLTGERSRWSRPTPAAASSPAASPNTSASTTSTPSRLHRQAPAEGHAQRRRRDRGRRARSRPHVRARRRHDRHRGHDHERGRAAHRPGGDRRYVAATPRCAVGPGSRAP